MSAFGGKAEVIQGVANCPLIAKSASSVGQGQHEISHPMVAKDTLFSLPGHLIRVVTNWSLPGKVSKYEQG